MKNRYLKANNIPEFKPFLGLSHPLLQTIVPYYIPYKSNIAKTERLKVNLPDGDQLMLAIHEPVGWQNGKPVVILIHGLAGCEDSTYLRRLGDKFFNKDLCVVKVNLRSCGPGRGLAKYPYHSGRSEDARAVIQALQKKYSKSALFQVGFSLSANITVKMLGEGIEGLNQLQGAVAVSPPLDLKISAHKITKLSFGIFDKFFLYRLHKNINELKQDFPNDIVVNFPKKMNMMDFDDHYTAPRSGFLNGSHYYEVCSGNQFVERIRLPTLLLHSTDDPVVESNCFDNISIPNDLDLVETNRGGHVGFLSRGGFWMDQLILDWVLRKI